ncbi:MAG: hypothetical protein LBD75_05980 [Candidatus Peribacteria bacterium]|jgi:hypothetical protein|nr:hypothetical protein [Candidatus Peribacteria bacterium]
MSDKEWKGVRGQLPKSQRKKIEKDRKEEKTSISLLQENKTPFRNERKSEVINTLRPMLECEGTYTFPNGKVLNGKFVIDYVVEINGKAIIPPISFDVLDEMSSEQVEALGK